MTTTNPQQPPGGGGVPVTQLEFHQAMHDFKTMFPEMDEDVIEVVLRSNNGAVDATIDQLLAMNADSENERVVRGDSETLVTIDDSETEASQQQPPRYSSFTSGATPPPSYNQAVPNNDFVAGAKRSNVDQRQFGDHLVLHKFPCASANLYTPSKDSLRAKFKWEPPVLGQLPPSFLRIDASNQTPHHGSRGVPVQSERRNSDMLSSALLQKKMEENERRRLCQSTDDPELSQYLEDERIAIFMQNEEFVQELRHNREFMSTLDIDPERGLPEGPAVAGGGESDDAFKEKLKKMSKASRKKFTQLATMFSRRKKGNFQHLLGGHSHHGSNPSRDNLLLNNEDEYSALQNEGSDSEDRGSRSWDSHGGDEPSSVSARSPRNHRVI